MNNPPQGIYVKSKGNFNLKCIVFALSLVFAYWFIPRNKNVFLLPVIFSCGYIAMGWYDKLYKCKERLYSGRGSYFGALLDSIFKPQFRDVPATDVPEGKELVSDQEFVYRRYMYMFHLMFIVPLFVYVGYMKGKGKMGGLLGINNFYQVLTGFSLLGMVYHGMRVFNPRKEQNRVVYLLHVLAILPLSLYVGFLGNKSASMAFTALLLLGGIAGVYHGIQLLTPVRQPEKK